VEIRRGSVTATPIFASSMAAGTQRRVSDPGTLYVTIGGDPANITMTVNGTPVRTAGDASGTVYEITKGKVTKL
jgi:hypothetical protein